MQFLEFLRMGYRRLCRLEQPVPQPLAATVADFGLPLVLAGTAGHQPETA